MCGNGRDSIATRGAGGRTATEGPPGSLSVQPRPWKVIFYFKPTCPYCRRQSANWRRVTERADGGRFEVTGLVDEAEDRQLLEEYLNAVGCGAGSRTPLRVAFVQRNVRRDYGLTATPVTLLVSSESSVEKNWPGARGKTEQADAARTLCRKCLCVTGFC